jgi:hypothetical protein
MLATKAFIGILRTLCYSKEFPRRRIYEFEMKGKKGRKRKYYFGCGCA